MATLATLSVTTTNRYFNPHEDGAQWPYYLTLDWKSTDLGVVSLDIVDTYNTAVAAGAPHLPYVPLIAGRIAAVETIPGTLGIPATNPPTNAYDITLLDVYGHDVADGNLGGRSSTVAEKLVFDTPVPIGGELTLTIANAGDAKNGRIIITMVY